MTYSSGQTPAVRQPPEGTFEHYSVKHAHYMYRGGSCGGRSAGGVKTPAERWGGVHGCSFISSATNGVVGAAAGAVYGCATSATWALYWASSDSTTC